MKIATQHPLNQFLCVKASASGLPAVDTTFFVIDHNGRKVTLVWSSVTGEVRRIR